MAEATDALEVVLPLRPSAFTEVKRAIKTSLWQPTTA